MLGTCSTKNGSSLRIISSFPENITSLHQNEIFTKYYECIAYFADDNLYYNQMKYLLYFILVFNVRNDKKHMLFFFNFKYMIYKNRHTFLRGLLRFEKSQQILNITYNKKDKYTITFMQHFTREKSYTGIVIPSSTIYKFIFSKYFVCV